ncbi:cell division protein ZapB [Dickeya fangzhongdai]|uniref:hypothetical protein n=1 Tax=Dickeya fangzhongdai TaxID=1778540 RepID=UPI003306A40F
MANEDMMNYVSRKEELDALEGKISSDKYSFLLNLLHKSDYDKFDELIRYEEIKNLEKSRASDEEQDKIKKIINAHYYSKNKIQFERKISELVKNLNSTILELEDSKEKSIKKDEKIKELNDEVSKLKSASQQEQIDKKIPTYVRDVKSKLDSDDIFFTKMANIWSICGATFGIGAIISSFYTFYSGMTSISNNGISADMISIFYIFTRGLLGIAFLGWLSYICFANARKYTHESIIRKDRQHALMFGQIFLQIYGSTATKEDATNVFKDWNMSGDSAFSSKILPPPNAMAILEHIKEILTSKNKKDSDSKKTDE